MAVPVRPAAGAVVESAWGGIVHDTAVAQDIQSGTVLISFSASAISNTPFITFVRPFGGPPTAIVVSSRNHLYTVAQTGAPSTTGFGVQGRRGDGTSTTTTVLVDWVALGPRA